MDSGTQTETQSQADGHRSDRDAALLASPLPDLHTDAIFQAVFQSAPDAILIVDAAGSILLANQQVERLFGYPRDHLIGRPVEMLLPETLRGAHVGYRARYVTAPTTRPMGANLDLVARRSDGSAFPVEISLSPLRTAEGLRTTAIIRDISDRRRTEQALRQSEDRFAKIFQTSPAAISMSTLAEGRIFDVNDCFLDLTGYRRDELVGRTTVGLGLWVDPAQRAAVIQMLAGQGRVHARELLFRTKAGEQRNVLGSAERIDLDGQPYLLMMIQDITDHKRAEWQIEQLGQRHAAHLDALLQFSKQLLAARRLDEVLQHALTHALALVPGAESAALYLYDARAEALALRASTGFTHVPQMTVPPTRGLVGLAFTTRTVQVTHSVAAYLARIPELSETERQHLAGALDQPAPPTGVIALPLCVDAQPLGVLLLLRRTGEGRFADEARATLEGLANLTIAAVLEAQGREEASELSHEITRMEQRERSLTERVTQAEAAVLQAARLAAIGQLAAGIAHEINNPLFAVRNALALLEEDLPPDLRDSAYVGIARDQLNRIAGIISRMRDFYRPDRGEMQPCAINQLLEETLALAGLNLRHGAINFVFTPALDLPPVEGNSDQLRQVFLNLVINAIDAMPDRGTLTVRTKTQATDVVVDIQDTGVGIPDEVRSRLFEPFFTSKPTGTGLGLSISGHIVMQHGGKIEVESSVGQGSTFRVRLPRQSAL